MSISIFSLRLLTFFAFTSDVKTTVGVRHETSMSVGVLDGGTLLGNETYSTNHHGHNIMNTIKTCNDVEGATKLGFFEKVKLRTLKKCKCKESSESLYCNDARMGRYFNLETVTKPNQTCSCLVINGHQYAPSHQDDPEALVVIDVQHCFTNGRNEEDVPVESGRESGDTGLQSERGDAKWKKAVVDYVKTWAERKRIIVLTQDFHPKNHVSFSRGEDDKGKREMDDPTFWHSNIEASAVRENESENQSFRPIEYTTPVFPIHCLQEQEESRLVDGLCEAVGGTYVDNACKVDAEHVKVVQKGMHQNIDSFSGIYDNRMGYIEELASVADNGLAKRASLGVLEWLETKKVRRVEAIGIADDYCVKSTVLDLANKEKAEKIGAKAIPIVEVNAQYTYGIQANLWGSEESNHGDPAVYYALKADLKKGGVKVELPEAVVPTGVRAKFSKKTHQLTVKLPLAAP